jgi:uncharacterized membrane protein YkvA (DUF1232 family)/SAM-dependent methyltransferase
MISRKDERESRLLSYKQKWRGLSKRLPLTFGGAREKAEVYLADKDRLSPLLRKALRKVEKSCDFPFSSWESLQTLVRMVHCHVTGRYSAPVYTILSAIAAIIYFVASFDLIPDFVPVLGLADDALIISFVATANFREISRFRDWENAISGRDSARTPPAAPWRPPELWDGAKAIVKSMLPEATREWIYQKRWAPKRVPAIGKVRFGSLRRFEPIARHYGMQWGQDISRYYIEGFLTEHAVDVKGRVLEIEDNTYTLRFGGDKVTHGDVLHVQPGYPKATIIADLTCADHISSDTFDCIVFTQTFQAIYDVRAVVRTLYRILKPGGIVLATTSGITKISLSSMQKWGDYWRLTSLCARRIFTEVFPEQCVQVYKYGNVLTATAFLQGMITKEFTREELDFHDPDYEVIVAVRATKPASLP